MYARPSQRPPVRRQPAPGVRRAGSKCLGAEQRALTRATAHLTREKPGRAVGVSACTQPVSSPATEATLSPREVHAVHPLPCALARRESCLPGDVPRRPAARGFSCLDYARRTPGVCRSKVCGRYAPGAWGVGR